MTQTDPIITLMFIMCACSYGDRFGSKSISKKTLSLSRINIVFGQGLQKSQIKGRDSQSLPLQPFSTNDIWWKRAIICSPGSFNNQLSGIWSDPVRPKGVLGQSAVLSCRVRGDVRANVHWQRNGVNITGGEC